MGNFLATAASGSTANSGFEGGKGTWTNLGNTTIADSSAQAHTGVDSLSMTSTAAGAISAAHCNTGNVLTEGLPCKPGQTVIVSAWFRAAATGRQCNCGVFFYNSSGSQVGAGAVLGTAVNNVTTGWTQVVATLVVPATALFAKAIAKVAGTGAGGEVHYVDDVVMFAKAGAIPYNAHWWQEE